jgi:undecaprenyldiphospho-muramoylpentapeptide beta-N-acetylglucosaminyltransferase
VRLIVCAGGTGGGVYPALTVLQTLGKKADSVLWVGSQGSMEAALVQRAGIPFTAIPAAGVHGVGLRAFPGNVVRLVKGTLAARRIIREYRPDVMLFTGGYVSVPIALAGRKIPILLFVPDIEPGMALKFLARFADCITVTSEESCAYFSKNANVIRTGYPIRPEFKNWDKANSISKLGLSSNLPVLLVFGGSQGARSINQALFPILAELLNRAQVIHISGPSNWQETEENLATIPEILKENYYPYPYLHEEMGAALAAADLVISRAGASVLGEFPHFHLPAILVPYPHAWKYQQVNADYLVQRNAAVVLKDAELKEKLLNRILDLLDAPDKLRTMSEAMSSMAAHTAADDIANQIQLHAKSYSKIVEGGLA